MSEYILELKDVVKTFGGVTALDGVHFQLKKGEIHALMGENGAGKSTFIKVITGVHQPDSGMMLLEGEKVTLRSTEDSAKLGIAAIYQHVTAFPDLSVTENIFMGQEIKNKVGLYNWSLMTKRAKELIEPLSKNIDVSKPMSTLSVAQQQLVEIAKALSRDARILIMDEPTVGIDPMARAEIWSYVKKMKENGISAIICTHNLYEIEQVCDRVIFLDNGNVQKQGKIEEIMREDEQKQELTVTVKNGIAEEIQQPLKELFQKNAFYYKEISFYPDSFLITVSEKANDVLPKIVKLMYDNGYALDAISVGKDSLEKVMAELSKEKNSL